MDYKIINDILNIVLLDRPRIIMADLYEICKSKIENVSLPQFRVEVSSWINDNTIPGFEIRKGPAGGIYKIGATNEFKVKQNDSLLDPIIVLNSLKLCLRGQTHITCSNLYLTVDTLISEGQFRSLITQWIDNGTLPGYEFRKGPTGGIYPVERETDKVSESESNFILQITPALRIIQSDDRNWAIQKKNAELWINLYYHPTIYGCINSIIKHIKSGDFKLSDSVINQLKASLNYIKEIEKRLEIKYENIIKNKFKE